MKVKTKKKTPAYLQRYTLPTQEQVESSWSEIEQSIDSGTGRQDNSTVNWLFFREPAPPGRGAGAWSPDRGVTTWRHYIHPHYTGEFHIPISNGVSVAAVKKIVLPLLRVGFRYVGYST